jgi:hypothetical protein
MTEIEKLIELWNARPSRVEPDNEEHLLYLFTGLLPALRDAMPKIVEMVAPPATGSPNTDLPPAPAPESSSHNPVQTPNTAGSGEGSGPTADNGGKPAASPAIVAETANDAAKRPGAAKRARTTKARKPVAAPPGQPQGIGETATV